MTLIVPFAMFLGFQWMFGPASPSMKPKMSRAPRRLSTPVNRSRPPAHCACGGPEMVGNRNAFN